MKKLLLAMLILVSGCSQEGNWWSYDYDSRWNDYAWYQPGKSVEQAKKDCEECDYEAYKIHSKYHLRTCMQQRGYRLIHTSYKWMLPDPNLFIQDANHWSSIGLYHTVAGE
jgi:hypothetical protein